MVLSNWPWPIMGKRNITTRWPAKWLSEDCTFLPVDDARERASIGAEILVAEMKTLPVCLSSSKRHQAQSTVFLRATRKVNERSQCVCVERTLARQNDPQSPRYSGSMHSFHFFIIPLCTIHCYDRPTITPVSQRLHTHTQVMKLTRRKSLILRGGNFHLSFMCVVGFGNASYTSSTPQSYSLFFPSLMFMAASVDWQCAAPLAPKLLRSNQPSRDS